MLGLLATGAVGAVAAACTPKVVEKTVKETVVIEGTPQVVEKVITATPAPKERVKIRYESVGWGAEQMEPWLDMMKRWGESQDAATAEYQDIPEGFEKIVAEAAGGVGPDAVVWETKQMYAYAAKGFFLPLDDLVTNSAVFKKDDFFPTDWDVCWFKGHMYLVPFDNSPSMVWYNPDLFDEAGVPYPPTEFGKWTWLDWLDTAKKLTKGEGAEKVFGWAGERWWVYLLPWVWSNGGMWLNEQKTECVLSSPESKEALQWAADLVRVHKVQPVGDQIIQGGNSAMFQARRAAMAQKGTWWAQVLKAATKESGLKWNVAPMPDGKVGSYIRNPGDGYGICQGSQHRPEAWNLIEFMSNIENTGILIQTGLSSSRKDVMFSDVFLKQEPTTVNWKIFADALDGHTKPHPDTAIFPQMDNLTQPEWEAVLDTGMSIDEFVNKVEGPINELLTECINSGDCEGASA